MENNFKIGDRVIMTSDLYYAKKGMTGTIKRIYHDVMNDILVEFDVSFSGGHTGDGFCKDSRGQFINSDYIELIKPESVNVSDNSVTEYIDRNLFCNEYCNCNKAKCDKDKCPVFICPTADVAPVVHAKWLSWEEKFSEVKDKIKGRHLGVFCSRCGYHADNPYDICTVCGAKMDLEDIKE